MKAIWKFSLVVTDVNDIEMPKWAKILKVDVNFEEQPQMWALVIPDAIRETRRFRIYGTGHPITATNLEFIDTFQQKHLGLVWHVFEEEV